MIVAGYDVRFERRRTTPRWLPPATPILAVVVALLAGAIVLLVTGHDPVASYQDMLTASFTTADALSSTFVSATPLLFTGLAAAIAFRMRAWNIGGDGQLYIGGIFAAAAGLALGDQGLAVALPAMLIAGIVGGALWAGIPGLLRAYANTNEVLTSLMLNYVAALVMYYLIFDSRSYWRDLASPAAQTFPQGKEIPAASFWPGFVGGGVTVPLGLLLGIALAVGLFVLIRSTTVGFRMRVVASSPAAGRYAGIRTRRVFVGVMLTSGALAGLAGASQIGDFSHTLEPRPLEVAAYGYAGIAGAALARYNPLGVIASALFLGGLTNAGYSLQGPDLPQGLVGVITGILLFCVAGSEIFTRFRIVVHRPGGVDAPTLPSPPPELEPVAGDVARVKQSSGSAS